jgi:hypothetical protein
MVILRNVFETRDPNTVVVNSPEPESYVAARKGKVVVGLCRNDRGNDISHDPIRYEVAL